MTKTVRIENADGSEYNVIIEVYDKGQDGAPDVLAKTVELPYPTAMVTDLYLTSSRYFVIKEGPKKVYS